MGKSDVKKLYKTSNFSFDWSGNTINYYLNNFAFNDKINNDYVNNKKI